MNQALNSNQKKQIMLRVITDIIILNVALFLAIALHAIWQATGSNSELLARDLLGQITSGYLRGFGLLTAIGVPVFYLFGFYTYGRSYMENYKKVVIFQAVTVTFLVFAFFIFMLRGFINYAPSMLIAAWIITLLSAIGARVWLGLWRVAHQIEERFFPAETTESSTSIEKVLVVGGGGYIGSALLKRMLENGYKVRLLDLLLFGTEPLEEFIDHPNLEIQQADFRHVNEVLVAMRDVDAVIHLGAIVGDPACAFDEELTIDVNLMATRMIAEVAKSVGVQRFIFASTCSVYGAGDTILNERSELNPVSLYARSKIASEQVLRQMADDSFIPILLRFGTIYGLSGRTRFDLVINLLTAKGLVDGEITVFGGDQWRPFVHVQDAALGVFRALEAPIELVANEVFNIGSNEQNYTIQQIGEIIAEMIPSAKLLNLGADSDPRNYRVDFSKARNILGLIPEWTVEKGVAQVKEAIESGKVKDYKDVRYSNVRSLKEFGMSYFKGEAIRAAKPQPDATIDFRYEMPFIKSAPNGEKRQDKDYVTELVGAIHAANGANGAHSSVAAD